MSRFLSLAALGSSFSPNTSPPCFVAKKKGYYVKFYDVSSLASLCFEGIPVYDSYGSQGLSALDSGRESAPENRVVFKPDALSNSNVLS